jgi:hypothetical protein
MSSRRRHHHHASIGRLYMNYQKLVVAVVIDIVPLPSATAVALDAGSWRSKPDCTRHFCRVARPTQVVLAIVLLVRYPVPHVDGFGYNRAFAAFGLHSRVLRIRSRPRRDFTRLRQTPWLVE